MDIHPVGSSQEHLCREDQENEMMFLEAMYGQDELSELRIVAPTDSLSEGFIYSDGETNDGHGSSNAIVEITTSSESPNPISQLRVRLQFVLIKMYPLHVPIIGCKSLIGASSSQCRELIDHLIRSANDRTGQVMLLDLLLVATEWLSARVRESNQGSLHELMMESQRQHDAQKVNRDMLETLPEASLPPSLEELTHQKESDMRRQWLLNRPELTGSAPRIKIDTGSFSANLSYTMSRFMKTQGLNQIKNALSSGTPTSSLLQTVHVLQQALVQQQFLVSHLLAHWIELTRSITGNGELGDILEYLSRESLIDSQQIDLVQYPGRIPTGSLFPQSDGSNACVALLTCPAERLGMRLSNYSSRNTDSCNSLAADLASRPSGVPPVLSVVSRFHQDFEQLQYLGSGAFGDVWKVRNRLDGMFYAIKKVRIGRFNDSRTAEELVANNKVVNRILREVTTLGRIHSPYVLRYHQAWIEESTQESDTAAPEATVVRNMRVRDEETLRSSSFFERHDQVTSEGFVSNAITGGSSNTDVHHPSAKQLTLYIQTAFCPRTLSDYLASEGTTATVTELWRLCRMMLEGLAHIHSHGIMHRDMKPSNIFIDSNGDIRIGDFGLATFDKGASLDDDKETREGVNPDLSTRVGTKLYSSPEQEGSTNGDYDERTDIYSLGIIFFELWYPFRTNYDRIEQISKLKEGVVPGKFAESHPRQWKLISTMIQRNLQDRPTATMLLQSDLLPPRMEDDFLNDALRVVSNPNTPIFPRILTKLFSVDRQMILNKPWPSGPIHQQLGPYLGSMPEQVILEQRKNKICSAIKNVFEMHGAVRYSAPMFNSYSPESRTSKEDEAVLMDHNGALISSRYDTRSNFAQTLAVTLDDAHSHLSQDVVFKRYDICTVYRKPPRPGFQPIELIRGEFDMIGVTPIIAECQCLDLSADVLAIFHEDIEWVRVCINHKQLFEFILREVGISHAQKRAVQRSLLDVCYTPSSSSRLDKWDHMRKALLSSGASVTDKQMNTIGRWFRTSTGSISEVFGALQEEIDELDDDTARALKETRSLIDAIERCQGPRFRENEYMVDLCFPPPSEDHNGLYFRVDVSYSSQPNMSDTLFVGGCINNTLSKLVRGTVPGMVGMTCNISKLVTNVTVSTSGVFGSSDVLVCAQRDSRIDEVTDAILVEQSSVASEIHQMGLSADVYYGNSSLQEQVEFASQRGFRYVVVLREKDISNTTEDGTRELLHDYNVSVRVISAIKGKQVREVTMKRSELRNNLAHRT